MTLSDALWDTILILLGTNLEVNLNEGKDRSDVKSKEAEMVKTEPDVKTK